MMGTIPPAAYSVGQFRDQDAEIARLAQQAAILTAAEEEALNALGLPTSGRLLDLGCGPGFVASRIRRSRPDLEVVGLDRDTVVLDRARTEIEVVEGDAEHLPFPAEHFDCVHARLVLRHLQDPSAAIQEAYRVLRPGGSTIIIDSDDGALVLYPAPDAFVKALQARQETFRRHGADPFIGRRLPALLSRAGFVDIAARTLVVDSVSVGRTAFARIVLSPVADAIANDLLSLIEVESATKAIADWARNDQAFGMTTVLALRGRKGG